MSPAGQEVKEGEKKKKSAGAVSRVCASFPCVESGCSPRLSNSPQNISMVET